MFLTDYHPLNHQIDVNAHSRSKIARGTVGGQLDQKSKGRERNGSNLDAIMSELSAIRFHV